jgi:hypothetical protein
MEIRDARMLQPFMKINQRAIPLLYRELDIVDAVRFLKQFTPGLVDYIQERKVLFSGKTIEQIIGEIEMAHKST